jgi:hypothetical protein
MALQLIATNLGEYLRKRLARLLQDIEEDEVPPSDEAQHACLDRLASAAARFETGSRFPFPHVGTSGEGDLTCEWQGDRRVVLFSISPQGKTALHRIVMSDTRVTDRETLLEPSPEALVTALKWFQGTDPSAE